MELVRTDTFKNIPRVLFEDSADEFMTDRVIDRIYHYNSEINANPANMVYEIWEDDQVIGLVWLVSDLLQNALNCVYIGVQKEYRDGAMAFRVSEFMEDLAKDMELTKLVGSSSKGVSYWSIFGWQASDTKIIYKEI